MTAVAAVTPPLAMTAVAALTTVAAVTAAHGHRALCRRRM